MMTQMISHYYAGDHDRLDGLFQQFQTLKRTEFDRAAECFRQFTDGLLRHIAWEEQILFPLFEQRTGLTSGGPTAVMRAEHQQIQSLLGLISLQVQQRDASTDALERDLLAVLGAHNQKEEQILYPAIDHIASDPDREEVFARMGVEDQSVRVVDVRPLAPPQRHPLIFHSFDALPQGGAFVLINDHDPKPLYYQFAAEHAGQFTWDYLEQGPTVWRVRIGRKAATSLAVGI